MAFDRPIEADSVKDFGLLSSLIRAPVVGILWLLGGEQANEDDDRQENKSTPLENHELGDAMGGDTPCEEGMVENIERGTSNTDRNSDLKLVDVNVDDDDPPLASDTTLSSSSPPTQINPIHNKENKSSSPQRPKNFSINDSKCKRRQIPPNINARRSSSSHISSLFHDKPDILDADATTEMIDDLVAVMERSQVRISGLVGPATDAFITSHSIVASSSAVSLAASYSATTFSTSHPSQSITNGTHPSQSLTQNESNPSIRGNKKMSWSDEGGNRSLVEYFDDTARLPRSKHWSAMKRNSCLRESRHSFDGNERGLGAQRSDVKVIKSALKRCGSYSPPGSMYASNIARSGEASNNSGSADSSTSSPDMKSFRSISMIGSSDSSRSASQDTDDSMAAVTDKFVNSNEGVPSTLQFGFGQASGGLIIPRGGPSDPRNCPGGNNESRYQLILGVGAPASRNRNVGEADGGTNQDVSAITANFARNPVSSTKSGSNNSPGNHHHFLPRHGNGYVSPQYGFYVNITPPTPELYAAKAWDQTSKHALQQQSYLQFQYQAPSPIPEGSPGLEGVIPQRFVGRSSVPRPSSSRSSSEEKQGLKESAKQKSLKPTFTKNKKGMGMLLAENSHHGVWPTVPFG